jgi:hypothetical protein
MLRPDFIQSRRHCMSIVAFCDSMQEPQSVYRRARFDPDAHMKGSGLGHKLITTGRPKKFWLSSQTGKERSTITFANQT